MNASKAFLAWALGHAAGSSDEQDIFTWLDQLSTTSSISFYRKTAGEGFYIYFSLSRI